VGGQHQDQGLRLISWLSTHMAATRAARVDSFAQNRSGGVVTMAFFLRLLQQQQTSRPLCAFR
jgi:hypothetical protein